MIPPASPADAESLKPSSSRHQHATEAPLISILLRCPACLRGATGQSNLCSRRCLVGPNSTRPCRYGCDSVGTVTDPQNVPSRHFPALSVEDSVEAKCRRHERSDVEDTQAADDNRRDHSPCESRG